MHFEQLSCFCELDLLCILGIGDIRIGKNVHILTKWHNINKISIK